MRLAIKNKIVLKIFGEGHINFSLCTNMVLGMHVILPNSVQIFLADEPKNTGVIESFSNWHKVDIE